MCMSEYTLLKEIDGFLQEQNENTFESIYGSLDRSKNSSQYTKKMLEKIR